jgi:hypothetical protein
MLGVTKITHKGEKLTITKYSHSKATPHIPRPKNLPIPSPSLAEPRPQPIRVHWWLIYPSAEKTSSPPQSAKPSHLEAARGISTSSRGGQRQHNSIPWSAQTPPLRQQPLRQPQKPRSPQIPPPRKIPPFFYTLFHPKTPQTDTKQTPHLSLSGRPQHYPKIPQKTIDVRFSFGILPPASLPVPDAL